MAFQARLVHGDPQFMDYTPGSAVAAGEVVVLGGASNLSCGIAHQDIPANWAGSLARGFGVYEVVADAAITRNTKVYWDNAAKRVTATATANAKFGYLVTGASGAGATCWAEHDPHTGP